MQSLAHSTENVYLNQSFPPRHLLIYSLTIRHFFSKSDVQAAVPFANFSDWRRFQSYGNQRVFIQVRLWPPLRLTNVSVQTLH